MTTVATRTRLWRWRVDNDWTLEEVADVCGLTKSYLSKVERGQRQPPPETRKKMARCLGVTIGEIFDVDDPAVAS